MPDEDHAIFEVASGKGTYMRSLARDIARRLGTVGHIAELRRTHCGPFSETASISLESLETLVHSASPSDYLLAVETALDDIPALAVTGEQASRLKNGNPVRVLNFTSPDDQTICVMHDQKPVALARYRHEWVEPVRVFNL
jgi:tRNA pseudouridine55 synthase